MFVKNGLAFYRIGTGEPILLMPYPHASAYQPMTESQLVPILNEMGYSVLTFDPPGIYHSSEMFAEVTLAEMIACSNTLLDFFEISKSVMVAGHSQSGFCSIAFAVEFPQRVKGLILIGSVSGWKMVRTTSIHKRFRWYNSTRWKMMYWGTRKMLHVSNLLIHKKLDQLVINYSFYNKNYCYTIPVEKSDNRLPDPIRAKWMVNLRKYNYDYADQLKEIKIPVLICVGKYDPQTPVEANMELKNKINHSTIEIFELSGHCPFIEEKRKFSDIIKKWLQEHYLKYEYS